MSNLARENGGPAPDAPHAEDEGQPSADAAHGQSESLYGERGGAYPPPDQSHGMPGAQPAFEPQPGDPVMGGGYGDAPGGPRQYAGGAFEHRQAPQADPYAGQPADNAFGETTYASGEAPQ